MDPVFTESLRSLAQFSWKPARKLRTILQVSALVIAVAAPGEAQLFTISGQQLSPGLYQYTFSLPSPFVITLNNPSCWAPAPELPVGSFYNGGDYLTLYDIPGLIPSSASVSGPGSAGFSASSANVGFVAYPFISPFQGVLTDPSDDPTLPNLTWTWVGAGANSQTPTLSFKSTVMIKTALQLRATGTEGYCSGNSQSISTVFPPGTLDITTLTLPDDMVGSPYTQTLAATGGTPPYTWSIASGALPGGLTLANGTITGTPTTGGMANFAVQVVDNTEAMATQSLSITTDLSVISPTTLPDGTVGSPYSQSLAVTGGTLPYTWSITSGALPDGLTLAGSTISGTPTTAGAFTFVVQVKDSTSDTASGTLSITVNPALIVATTTIPGIATGLAYRQPLTATGGSGSYTWCVQSASDCVQSASPLPDGFTLTPDGLLTSTGSPLAKANSYPLTVQVTDSDGNVATRLLTLEISCSVYDCRDTSKASKFGCVSPLPGPPYSLDGKPITENASFTPTDTAGLDSAARLCGFTGFDWQQMIDSLPAPSGLFPYIPAAVNPKNLSPTDGSLQAPPSIIDPPPGGYIGYDEGDTAYPFYYNSSELDSDAVPCIGTTKIKTTDTLSFQDCPNLTVVKFTTSLVGALPCTMGSPGCGTGTVPKTLFTWTWESTFNGTLVCPTCGSGGVSQSKSIFPLDPNSGTGGVTVTSINGIPTPTVTATPSATTITTTGGLTVEVAVDGASGSPTPTGSITITSGSYASAATTLRGGAATISIPAGVLVVGSDTLAAVYRPDDASATLFSVSTGVAAVSVNFPQSTPQITAISPNYGAPAAFINIAGANFGATQGNGSVIVGDAFAQVTAWSDTAITIRVPSRAATGNLTVTAGRQLSNGVPFQFYPEPSISGLSVDYGLVGAPVTINGSNLMDAGGNGKVTFNGVPAPIISQTESSIQVDVPAGARTGDVRVLANGVVVLGPDRFAVTEITPVIYSVYPDYGAPSAFVTLTGIDFGSTQNYGLVIVGGVRAEVTAWSDTSIKFRVPSGATAGGVAVEQNRESSGIFDFTFYGEPSVTNVSVNSAPVGGIVTIAGSNLLDEYSTAITFNGVIAELYSGYSGGFNVVVPTGATSGPLLVRANGVKVIASTNFTITASGP
jgi:hypothetical protein